MVVYVTVLAVLLAVALVAVAVLFARDRRQVQIELRALAAAQSKGEGLQLLNQSMIGLRQSVDARIKEANDRLVTATDAFSRVQHALGRIDKLGESVEGLQALLGSQKLRGGLGEQIMADVLAEFIPPERRELQVTLRSGVRVDAAVATAEGLIPIDAKFPLENFTRAAEAQEPGERAAALRELHRNARRHVNDIAAKYICPPETVDFAIMYVPADSVFAAIQEDPAIAREAASRRVFIVSPSIFCPLLSLIMLNLEGERLAHEARNVMAALRSLQRDGERFEERLGVTAGHVRHAGKAVAELANEWERLRGSIDSAAQIEAPVEVG